MPRRLTIPVTVLLAATAVAVITPNRPAVVVGRSMAPTYDHGEILRTVKPLTVEPGDTVVIRTPEGMMIKRVVLVGGEKRYQIRKPDGWDEMIGIVPKKTHAHLVREVRVPEDRVYVLGDNMWESVDSRHLGPIPASWITAKVAKDRLPEGEALSIYTVVRKIAATP